MIRHWIGTPAALAVGLLLFASGEGKTQREDRDVKTATGKVTSFTTAPKGETDGAILEDGTVIHWPPHLESRFTGIVDKGDRVKVAGWMETTPAGDRVLEVRTLTNLRTNAAADNDGPPPPPPGRRGRAGRGAPPPPLRAVFGETRTVRGKVDRFTKAPRGEVDGTVLDDGTWLHWPPHLENRFADILKEGDRVQATGRTETGPAGDSHFEVQSVTNMRTNARAENPDFAEGPPVAGPTRVAPRREESREEKLRDLENKLDQLRREIERLRRDG
jgi:hypothetical protein